MELLQQPTHGTMIRVVPVNSVQDSDRHPPIVAVRNGVDRSLDGPEVALALAVHRDGPPLRRERRRLHSAIGRDAHGLDFCLSFGLAVAEAIIVGGRTAVAHRVTGTRRHQRHQHQTHQHNRAIAENSHLDGNVAHTMPELETGIDTLQTS